ncbi:MAG: hypothetical protein JHC38_01975 [Thiotrichales bacterium]|jgi:hypothetical protein|nr:hypothetical protein [Thiotrichales bacterium]
MQQRFKQYLIDQGYKEYTPKGHSSTVYAYIRAVDRVCKREGLTWTQLAENISNIIKSYDVGGQNEVFGKKSNRTVISALKKYEAFLGVVG